MMTPGGYALYPQPHVLSPDSDDHYTPSPALRVQVPNNSVLGFWGIVIVVEVLGKYMMTRYLDPWGSPSTKSAGDGKDSGHGLQLPHALLPHRECLHCLNRGCNMDPQNLWNNGPLVLEFSDHVLQFFRSSSAIC